MKYVALLFLMFLGVHVNAQRAVQQKDTLPNNSYNVNNYPTTEVGFELKIGGGVLIPQGRLANYIGPSPVVEVNFGMFHHRNKSIDGVLQFVAPQQQERFQYARIPDTLNVKSKMVVNYFFRFKKNLIQHQHPSQFNIGLGIGGSSITTDARNPFYSGEEGESKYEFVTSFLLIPGLEFSHTFARNATFTLGLDVQITSYKMEGALQENIGGMALIPRLSYTF